MQTIKEYVAYIEIGDVVLDYERDPHTVTDISDEDDRIVLHTLDKHDTPSRIIKPPFSEIPRVLSFEDEGWTESEIALMDDPVMD